MKLQILCVRYIVEKPTHLHYNVTYLYNQWHLVVCIIAYYKVKMKIPLKLLQMKFRIEHVTNLQIHTIMQEIYNSNGFLPLGDVRYIHKHLLSLLVIFIMMFYFWLQLLSAVKSEEIHQFIQQVGNIETKLKDTELYANIYIVSALEP